MVRVLVQEDSAELALGRMPEELISLPEFLQSFLLQKYGLPSLLESHMYAIVECTQRLGSTSGRLRLFGILVGVIEPDTYTPRLAALFLHFLRVLYPRFTANTLRSAK